MFDHYEANGVFDEMFATPDKPRAHYQSVVRRLSKLIRDEFPKVKPSIQGDAIRVSGKSKDELQKVIVRLRGLDEPVPLQFENYR